MKKEFGHPVFEINIILTHNIINYSQPNVYSFGQTKYTVLTRELLKN